MRRTLPERVEDEALRRAVLPRRVRRVGLRRGSPECASRGRSEKAKMARLCVGIYDFLRNIVLSTQLSKN